jgi:hypothetical protein
LTPSNAAIEEFDERYDTENLQAALADAGFDSQDNREFCQEKLDCPLLTAIKERMHRHLRAGVQRVFSRLKSFTGLDRVRARKEDNVETHVVLSAVALVAASLTAKRQDKPGLIRSPSRLI